MGSGFSLDWEHRSDGQKVAFVTSVLVFIAAIACLVANIILMKEADDENWFGGDVRRTAMFFIMGTFRVIFCLLVMAAELTHLDFMRKWAKILRFMFVRGTWQIFVGLWTAAGDQSIAVSSKSAEAVSGIGYALVITGALMVLMSLCCFKEYSEEVRQREGGDTAPTEIAAPGGETTGPPTAAAASNVQPSTSSPAYPPNESGSAYRI